MDHLVTYSLLSVIRERRSNLKSIVEIYEELCETILADNSFEKSGKGIIDDLKAEFFKKFGLTIPYPTLKLILRRLSTRSNHSIQLFTSDYSFSFSYSDFKSLNADIKTEKANLEELKEAFNLLCEDENIDPGIGIEFFVQINKKEIVAFLNNEDFSFSDRPEFGIIQTLLTVPDYHEEIIKLVSGSLISTLLEFDLEKQTKLNALVLDTNFIISLFDLHSEESFATCNEIVAMALKNKIQILVLPETIEETTNLLRKKSEEINKIQVFKSADRKNIEYGCFRRKLSGSDLSLYANKVRKLIINAGGIIIDQKINDRIKNRIEKSTIYQKLKDRKRNKEGAMHDAIAQEFVASLRSKDEEDFSDITAFFVSDSNGFLENRISHELKIPYMIRAEELLNILWILNPLSTMSISPLNITRIFTTCLSKKLPDKEMLKLLDSKFKHLKDLPIYAKDCSDIYINLSVLETRRLTEIIEEEDENELEYKISQLALEAREQAESKEINEKARVEKLVKRIEEKKANVIQAITQKQSAELSKKDKELEQLNAQIKDSEEKNTAIKTYFEHEFSTKNARFQSDNLKGLIANEQERLELIEEHLSDIERSIRNRRAFIGVGTVFLLFIFSVSIGLKLVIPNWDLLEPISWIIGIFLSLSYALISITTGSINPKDVLTKMLTKLFKKITDKKNTLIDRRDASIKKIQAAELELKAVRI